MGHDTSGLEIGLILIFMPIMKYETLTLLFVFKMVE